jgi:hypothetical protein
MIGPSDAEIHVLEEAFKELFHIDQPPKFGSRSLKRRGWYDGNKGVQWNTGVEWHDVESGIAYLGVNLEGMKYKDWPIARLIKRELENQRLFEIIAILQDPPKIELWWWRDAWQIQRRLGFKENRIKPTPTALSNLSQHEWSQTLHEAQGCLATPEGRRATQEITLQDGQKAEREVSPHIQFRQRLPWPATAEELGSAMRSARENLQPLHAFLTERCAR